MKTKEYEMLVEISNKLRSHSMENQKLWKGSPFEWLKEGVPSRKKGKVGEEMVREFLIENGFSVSDSVNTDHDLIVNNYRMEVKLSTLWESGHYKFQQIRKQKYDVLFCLGISPHSIHAWVARKSDIVWSEMSNQHGGRAGTDTWWIQIYPPKSPHGWMHSRNGDLSKVCDELRKIVTE